MQDEGQYERNPDFIFRRIVDQAVLVPIFQEVGDMDCIYTLNGVGAFVWGRLEVPATRDELVQAIADEYAADEDAVAADLERFLGEMVSIGAIRKV